MSNLAKRAPVGVQTTRLAALDGKKTAQCFPDDLVRMANRDFERKLPAYQPNTDSCVISMCKPFRFRRPAETAAYVLDVPVGTPIKTLGNLLIERGHTMTLPQVELMWAAERGLCYMRMTKGHYESLGFFIETDDSENPVLAGSISYCNRRHELTVFLNLLNRTKRYIDEYPLLRNVDPLKLGH